MLDLFHVNTIVTYVPLPLFLNPNNCATSLLEGKLAFVAAEDSMRWHLIGSQGDARDPLFIKSRSDAEPSLGRASTCMMRTGRQASNDQVSVNDTSHL